MRGSLAYLRAGVLSALGLAVAACSTLGGMLGTSSSQPGQVGSVQGFLGGVVADEPLAALAGREALSTGANAADAATAIMTTMWVTLPSRAGLGGGGACLAYFASPKSPKPPSERAEGQ